MDGLFFAIAFEEGIDGLFDGLAFAQKFDLFEEELPIESIGMIEVFLLQFFEGYAWFCGFVVRVLGND